MEQHRGLTWIAVALILGISLIGSTVIVTDGVKAIKSARNTLDVKGSAKEQIKSDYAVWTGAFSANSPDLKTAYQELEDSAEQVKDFLIGKGFTEKDLIFSSVNTIPMNVILPNGMYSNAIESYRLMQTVEIRSNDVDKIAETSRIATELINLGVTFESYAPQYFYTQLADMKINMIELATKDAQSRAEAMLKTTGRKPGDLVSASVGVFQITPLYSNEISDYGINDTSSIDKEITAVVSCSFEVE